MKKGFMFLWLAMSVVLLVAGLFFAACNSIVKEPPVASVPDSVYCQTIAALPQPPQAVGVRGKFWKNGQDIRVLFVGGTSGQRQYVKDAFSIWAKYVNLNFKYVESGPAECRVGFVSGDGSWSYIGTDNAQIPSNRNTMNIGWSGLDVCLHEIGHFLGLAHEQQSPNSTICWNKERVYKDLGGPPNNWSRQMVDSNVFGTLSKTEAVASAFDGSSIMEYPIPGAWTCTGVGIPGGSELSQTDKAFICGIYPSYEGPPKVVVVSDADAVMLLLKLRKAKTEIDSCLHFAEKVLVIK